VSRYIVGVTGASGSVYAVRLLEELLSAGHEVHLVVSQMGREVMEYETGKTITPEFARAYPGGKLVIHPHDDLFASISSGSYPSDGMVIVPCSMTTLGEIAAGTSRNLLGRAADVCIKERRKLVLVPRELPFSSIHLRNMLTLSETGVVILPANPGFYHKPETVADIVDFIVSRILDSLGIENNLYHKWRPEE
jgi:4-hydroxy-3-polyprenylbenzoate decarboxylase